MTIYTIGHSTRALQELVALLKEHGIQLLVDIRSFRASRRLPHFNRESLEARLPEAGIPYRWMGHAVGGYRKKRSPDSLTLRYAVPASEITPPIWRVKKSSAAWGD